MSIDGYLRLLGAILGDWRVLVSILALFLVGALLRFVAVGNRNPGVFKQPILKLIKKMAPQGAAGAASAAQAPKEGDEDVEGSEDIGLKEEEYPAEEPDDEKPKRGKK